MINATSQKRALKATPKLVFGVRMCVGMHAPPAKHMASIRLAILSVEVHPRRPHRLKENISSRTHHAKTGQRILVEE